MSVRLDVQPNDNVGTGTNWDKTLISQGSPCFRFTFSLIFFVLFAENWDKVGHGLDAF